MMLAEDIINELSQFIEVKRVYLQQGFLKDNLFIKIEDIGSINENTLLCHKVYFSVERINKDFITSNNSYSFDFEIVDNVNNILTHIYGEDIKYYVSMNKESVDFSYIVASNKVDNTFINKRNEVKEILGYFSDILTENKYKHRLGNNDVLISGTKNRIDVLTGKLDRLMKDGILNETLKNGDDIDINIALNKLKTKANEYGYKLSYILYTRQINVYIRKI